MLNKKVFNIKKINIKNILNKEIKLENKNGVTLISLIITIIILLILAGVTIRISIGNNGIINKAKIGVAFYENASKEEEATLDEYANHIEKMVGVVKTENLELRASTTEWTKDSVTITAKSLDPKYTIQMKSEDTDWSITTSLTVNTNQKVYAKIQKSIDKYSEEIASINVTNIDNEAPTTAKPTLKVSTNSITVTCKQIDKISGIKIREYSIDDGVTWKASGTTYTFDNLTQGQTYTIITRATDMVGNQSISEKVTQNTLLVPIKIALTPSTTSWTNQDVIVTASTSENGYTLQTSTDGTNWGETNPLIFSSNGIAYARLWDGKNSSASTKLTIDNIDKTAPTSNLPTLVNKTANSITIKNNQTDELSGAKTYQFSINGEDYVTDSSTDHTHTFRWLSQNTTFSIKTKLIDEAGNETETSAISEKVVTIPWGFYYVGGDTLTGLVISSSSSDENKGTSYKNLVGNQYVWIPATSSTYKRDESWYIEYDTGGYGVKDYAKRDEATLSSITSSQLATEDTNNGITVAICKNIASQVAAEKASVAKYGGYYIGRYEQGIGNVIKQGVYPYTNLKWISAYNNANSLVNTTSAKSYLCSSYAWDTALNYIMANTSYKNYATSIENMNENWYGKAVVNSSGTIIKQASAQTKLQCGLTTPKYNIFDMSGNVVEFTTEIKPGHESLVIRAGVYNDYYAIQNLAAGARWDGRPDISIENYRIP